MNVMMSPHIMQQCKEWDINCFQLCLLIWIKSLEQEQEGRRHFNQREVAMKLGVSRETVNKNLAVLLKKKLLHKPTPACWQEGIPELRHGILPLTTNGSSNIFPKMRWRGMPGTGGMAPATENPSASKSA
ncbi:hypothetical protein [Laceyella sacchari]|uniref:HTH crp-type domain-containing protein n=1 Tax=Laceyella sacchari TaxID=37482 RepID=A0ABY5U2S1_LACSH|nr:hypothetical protein [Laceyella sacchari]UWE03484.1 hypothetical protein NYR52_15500 [Laceyella sacchari]